MTDKCEFCQGFCEDLLQMTTTFGEIGEIHNTVWVSTDDLPDDNDPSELKMDFSFEVDGDEVFEKVETLRINFCPMCGRKLK